MFGVKRTGDLLEQLSWGFASGIAVLALVSKFLLSSGGAQGINSVNVDKAATKTLPAASAPAPASSTPAPAPAPAGK
ncbi:hypothetical protein ACFFJX_14670 [Pseudarcicella hirudinis]